MKRLLYTSCLILFSGILVFFSACNRDLDEFDGPSLVDRFGPFRLVDSLAVSAPTADFASNKDVFFTAKFNKRINWVVQITGLESGAVKEITGFSTELGSDNATWNGTTTQLPLFRAEKCLAKLILPEEDSLTQSLELESLSGRIYEGNLVTDFEEASSNIMVRNFEFEFSGRTGVSNVFPAGSGENFLLLEGTDGVLDNYFVGLIEILSPITGEQFIPMPSNVPEDVYFNAFIYGTGDPYTIAILDFYADGNGDGVYNEGPDTPFSTGDIVVNWTGWRLYSLNMSDLGISETQLSELVGMRAVLISDNNSQPTPRVQVSFGLDYMTFTKDQPLMP